MRKWLWLGTLTVVLGSIGAFWYFHSTAKITIVPDLSERNRAGSNSKDDGNAEMSDVIEPLIVDRGVPILVKSVEPPICEEMPRVVLAPGMQQPPRPDATPGLVLRMPYADEEEILGLRLDPYYLRIMESKLAQLNIFDDLKDPSELSEPPEDNPPAVDYHHQYPHCPYHGPYPSAYPYRTMPRD